MAFSLLRAQVQYLVEEVRFHKPHGLAKFKKKKEEEEEPVLLSLKKKFSFKYFYYSEIKTSGFPWWSSG